MINSKLIDVFYSLSNKEIKELSQFIRSPYFNRREEVVKLYDYLVENKDISKGFFVKNRVWKRIFVNQDYDDSVMRYTMSFLFKAIKDFLIHQELLKDKPYTQVLLCRTFRKRGMDQLFKKELGKAMDLQEKQPFRNTDYHFNNYLLYTEEVEAYPTQKMRTEDPKLQKSIDELTLFYISNVLKQSCGVLSVQAMMQKNYSMSFLNEILKHVEETDYSDRPSIEIYYNIYRALSDLNEERYFNKLKDLIENHWSDFPLTESRAIYLLAINCCIKRLNKGNKKYIREGFELYKSGLENKVLLENGILSKYTYTNASRLGLALDEFEWVESFLKNYKSYLPVSERENNFIYNMAFFYFQKPDYENAMELLKKVDLKDVLNNLDARRMLLRIYYELGEYKALDSLLDSFNVYLGRQKNIGYHKDNYANLIFFVKKILRSNLSDKTQINKLLNEIEATPSVAEKAWLLDQLK